MTSSIITADKSWLETIAEVKKWGQAVEPQNTIGAKGRVSFEILNHSMLFDMRWPIVTTKPNTSWLYMAAEPMWVLEGSGNINHFPEIYRIQLPYSNNGSTTYGAYGPRYKLQKQNVIDRLNDCRSTRQAVMTIWRRNPPLMVNGVRLKDTPCTTSIQWLIRDGKIYTIVTMRSSDAGLGLPYDMLTFTCMTAEIAAQLKDPPELGVCHINAGSRHIYEDQWDKLIVDDMVTNECYYAPWETWKWPAIRIGLKKIAVIDRSEFNITAIQGEAFKWIMELSGGKTVS